MNFLAAALRLENLILFPRAPEMAPTALCWKLISPYTFNMNFLVLKTIGFLSPSIQIAIIVVLFVLMTLYQYREVQKTGKMFFVYPVSVSILFAPLYEEIIFRGFMLSGFLNIYSITVAVVLSSFLFGLWHFKNIFWEGRMGVTKQMLYAGVIVGPIFALVTIWTGTIWVAVILHYINNLWAPISRKIFKKSVY